MCLSVHPAEFSSRKCLQSQQGVKWGLKNRTAVWHGQLSVSAALTTTGSALSDKYKHSRPSPAFQSVEEFSFPCLSMLQERSQSKPVDREWERSLLTVPAATLSIWGEITAKQLRWLCLPGSLPIWQNDWHLTSKQWHKHVKTLHKRPDSNTCNNYDRRTYSPSCNYTYKDGVFQNDLFGSWLLSQSGLLLEKIKGVSRLALVDKRSVIKSSPPDPTTGLFTTQTNKSVPWEAGWGLVDEEKKYCYIWASSSAG